MVVSIRRFEGTDGEGKRLPKGGWSYKVQSDESELSELWLSENLGNESRSRVERVSTFAKINKDHLHAASIVSFRILGVS